MSSSPSEAPCASVFRHLSAAAAGSPEEAVPLYGNIFADTSSVPFLEHVSHCRKDAKLVLLIVVVCSIASTCFCAASIMPLGLYY